MWLLQDCLSPLLSLPRLPRAELPFMSGGQCGWWYRCNGGTVPGLAACSCHPGSTHSLTAAPSAGQGSHGWVVPGEGLTQRVPASLTCGELWPGPASFRASGYRVPACRLCGCGCCHVAPRPQGRGSPDMARVCHQQGRRLVLGGEWAVNSRTHWEPTLRAPSSGQRAWPSWGACSLALLCWGPSPGREQPQTCSRGWSRWLEFWVQLPSAQLMSGWRWFGAPGTSEARLPPGSAPLLGWDWGWVVEGLGDPPVLSPGQLHAH